MTTDLQNAYLQMINENYFESPPSHDSSNMGLVVAPYKNSRAFAVYEDGELLVVTVYKKGAEAVAARIRELKLKR